MSYNQEAEKFIDGKFKSQILEKSTFRDELTYIVDKNDIIDILTYLKNDEQFAYNFLTDLTATDWPERKERQNELSSFSLLYSSFSLGFRIAI